MQTVSELMDPSTGQWDERLVRDTFCAEDARHILQMPLREGVHDFVAWQFESKGIHSVKSAYKLHMELKAIRKNGGVGQSTAEAGNLNTCSDDSWKRIWRLPCPRTVQMFTWRLRHESLALLSNMQRRGLKVESTKCFFYGQADEDGGHLSIKCKSVKVVWRELGLEKERRELQAISSVHVMMDYLWELNTPKRMQILTFWWMWWSARNKLRNGERVLTAAEVARRARSSTLEYMQVFLPEPKPQCTDKWRPPAQDMVKFNVDGAFVPGELHAGWGAMARTSDGEVVGARAGRQELIQDAFAAEVVALSNAVSFAADLGIIRAEFETDSQLLAEAMDIRKVDSSAYAFSFP